MSSVAPTPTPETPYRGIHPFRYRDRALFFGREEAVSTLLAQVLISRVTVLFGESGAGKSSVLNAGLVPALKKEGMQAERVLIQPDAPIVAERMEGDTPEHFLPSIFSTDSVNRSLSDTRLRCALDRFVRTVRASTPHVYPVLIFDQFEQLFTLFDRDRRQEQRAIVDTILEIVNDETLRAKVVIGIREDFLAKLDIVAKQYPRIFASRLNLKKLDARSAHAAILQPFGPPNLFNSELTAALAGTLIDDLVQESPTELIQPTHLQIVCKRLWDQFASTRQRIGEDEYQALGRLPGIISGYLESEFGHLDAKQKTAAVRCLASLVTECDTRDVVSQGKLRDILVRSGYLTDAELEAALAFLTSQRLVDATPRRDTLFYEIASEYLIPPVRRELETLRMAEEKQKERQAADRRLAELKLESKHRQRRLISAAAVLIIAVVVGAFVYVSWKRNQEQTYGITYGQIEQLRKQLPLANEPDGDDPFKKRKELVLESVANYLWGRGDIEELQRVLAHASDLPPRRYGVDEELLSKLTALDADTAWPLELYYSPDSAIDQQLLAYYWQNTAESLRVQWGIPVPSRIKLIADKSIPTREAHLVASTYGTDSNLDTSEISKVVLSLPGEPDQYFLEEPDDTVLSDNDLLRAFVAKYRQSPVDFKSSPKIVKRYYDIPRWTLPVWKVAGYDGCYSREGLIALVIAARILEEPSLIATESVRAILARVAERRPKTVEEALAARGGLNGLTADLRTMVAEDIGLINVEFVLDLLADFPGYTSAEAVDRALRIQDSSDGFPTRLPGRPTQDTRELATALAAKGPFQSIFDEASRQLAPVEQPIRILLGSELLTSWAPDDQLAPQVQERLTQLRGKFYSRFGFSPPVVRFRDEDGLQPREFRIELLNQTRAHPDAAPIPTTPDSALETLIEQLERRYADYRVYWLDSDEVDRQLAGVPDRLKAWLLEHYTLTDVKLLLQALVNSPTEGHTIRDPAWLLGSLVFLAGSRPQEREVASIVEWLRQVQRARFDDPVKTRGKPQTVELIRRGIEQLESDDTGAASRTFREALAINRADANAAFISLYAERTRAEMQIAHVANECKLPGVGKVTTHPPPSFHTRYKIEDLLSRFGSLLEAKQRRSLELCLLWVCANAKHAGAARTVLDRLRSEGAGKWPPDEEYRLAAFLVLLHGSSKLVPRDIGHIEELFQDSARRVSTADAEAMFHELLGRNREPLPLWRTKLLLSLAGIKHDPASFWIPYSLGEHLSGGRNIEETDAALSLLGEAQARIHLLKPDERARLAAWIDFNKANAWFMSMLYGKPSAHTKFRQAIAAIKTQSEKGWPPPDEVSRLVINGYLFADELAAASKSSEEWLRQSPSSPAAREMAVLVRLANLDVEGALTIARRGNVERDKQDEVTAFWIATLELLSGAASYEASARYLLEKTENANRDYVRLMLFWRLRLDARDKDAAKLLEERWTSIDPGTWAVRLEQGDDKVWREMLIGYSSGQKIVSRKSIFPYLRDPTTFQSSPLNSIGMPFAQLHGEAHFYDALLQEVSGDLDRSRRALEETTKVRLGVLYEYYMARYLLAKGSRNGESGGTR